MTQGIRGGGSTQLCGVDVCVDLRRVQILVAQNLLQGSNVHTVLQHERGSRVPQLVTWLSCTEYVAEHALFTWLIIH